MASQHIQFQIGSEFSGEGFKAAQAATTALNNNVRQAAGTVGQLASAVGGMDNAVGKAATAMTGMLNTFMTLNPVVIGLAAAISALNYVYNESKKAVDALKEEVDDLEESLRKTAEASNAAFTDAMIARLKESQRNFEQITKHANDMTAAMNGLANAQAQGGIISLQAEKLQAVMDQVTEEARQLTAAEYDLRIATEKAAVARQQAQQQSDAAHQAVVNSQKELEHLEHQRASAVAAVKIMEERIAESKAKGLETEENDAKRLEQLRSQIADIDSRTVSVKSRLEVELVKEQTAAANLANATAQTEMEVTAAKGKIEELKWAHTEAINAEKLAAGEEFLRAEILREKNDTLKEAEKIQKDVNDGARELEKAEREYAKVLAEYEKNYAHNEMTNDILNGEKYGKGMAIPVRVDGRIMADVQAKDLENAIKDGLVGNVRDMDKFIRENAQKRLREEQKAMNQLRNERQRYERLQQKSRKSWSKADTDFATKFEKLAKAAEDRKKEVENAKKRLEEEKKRAEENAKNLKEIKKKLDRLGLK